MIDFNLKQTNKHTHQTNLPDIMGIYGYSYQKLHLHQQQISRTEEFFV